MKLIDRISEDIAAAIRARNQATLAPLRMAKAALMNREVEKGRPLDEAESQQVIVSLIKQRRDSIEQFTKGAREDLAAREAAEITILEPYLPPPVDAGDVEREIDAAIAESGATADQRHGPRDERRDEPTRRPHCRRARRQRSRSEKAWWLKQQTFSRDSRLMILKGTHKPLIHPP